MGKGFLKRVYKIINMADIVLEVTDARFVELTRNRHLEERAKRMGKRLIVVINKADLSSKKELLRQKKKLPFPSIFISTKNRKGLNRLKQEILKQESKKTTIAVIGYPNTGKSSIINLLVGKHAARVSSRAGFTRGEQFVKIRDDIKLVDSPGIIPFEERDAFELALLGAKNPEDLEDLELGGIKLLGFLKKRFPEKIEKMLEKKPDSENPEEQLAEIAIKWNKIKKQGIPDIQTAAKILLKKWQDGKI